MSKKKKIWQVGQVKSDPLVEEFTVGEDFTLDQEILRFDVQATQAHANMLHKIDVLTASENKKLQSTLRKIAKLHREGNFPIHREQEDGHTAIEDFLVKECGDIGKKIHTGRSRNDQVLVAMRLFMKEKLTTLGKDLDILKSTFREAASRFSSQEMPGYTHYQKAMPTTAGVWLESFACALEDTELFFHALEKLIDQNPLGSASGFGIRNFILDREMTSQELNFSRVQENPIYCGFSRGYFENIFLDVLSQVAISLMRFSSDLLLFSTQEFDFINIPEIFTTGSSIMPQKRNPDTIEIMQGKLGVFFAKQSEIKNIITKLTSGYHREFQLIKRPFFEGLKIIEDSLRITQKIVKNISFKKEKLREAMTEDLLVTEKIYELVKKEGMPFRDAYQKVKKEFFI